jgi:hypothetical protein
MKPFTWRSIRSTVRDRWRYVMVVFVALCIFAALLMWFIAQGERSAGELFLAGLLMAVAATLLLIAALDLSAWRVRQITSTVERIATGDLEARVPALLAQLQTDLLERARRFRDENTRTVASFDEFRQVIEDKRGFIRAGWNGDPAVELKIKEETKATIRCIPLGDDNRPLPPPEGLKCIYTGEPAKYEVYFARAY